jgi:molybdopterin-guanine dinucleotide biosynthesis protein
MIVVVGGSSRKVGKTTVMCEIINVTREAGWTALKISPHDHQPGHFGDTDRYIAAGAVKAQLMNDSHAWNSFDGNLIIESNAILDLMTPDIFVFVAGSGEWKSSAVKHADKADFTVYGHVTPELIERIRAFLR